MEKILFYIAKKKNFFCKTVVLPTPHTPLLIKNYHQLSKSQVSVFFIYNSPYWLITRKKSARWERLNGRSF